MSATKKAVSGVAGATLMLGALAAGATPALAVQQPDSPAVSVEEQASTCQDSARVSVEQVLGSFSFNQTETTPTEMIAKAMKGIAKYACGASGLERTSEYEITGLSDWTLSVNGAVDEGYTATLEELIEGEETASFTMGCSCAGNPSDGLGSVNANVTGLTVAALLDRAGLQNEANTIVFTSSDGYEIALPLSYVLQRYSLIVFDINGDPLCDSMGGTNQLWLGSTSARYFARDIVEITLENRQTPPPIPGTPEAEDSYANVPNVNVTESGMVEG